jgi:hypothetical protein
MICGKPSNDAICESCKNKIRGRNAEKEAGGQNRYRLEIEERTNSYDLL